MWWTQKSYQLSCVKKPWPTRWEGAIPCLELRIQWAGWEGFYFELEEQQWYPSPCLVAQPSTLSWCRGDTAPPPCGLRLSFSRSSTTMRQICPSCLPGNFFTGHYASVHFSVKEKRQKVWPCWGRNGVISTTGEFPSLCLGEGPSLTSHV